MRCPMCQSLNDRVVDARPNQTHTMMRRRRQCGSCGARFTTYEMVQPGVRFDRRVALARVALAEALALVEKLERVT